MNFSRKYGGLPWFLWCVANIISNIALLKSVLRGFDKSDFDDNKRILFLFSI